MNPSSRNSRDELDSPRGCGRTRYVEAEMSAAADHGAISLADEDGVKDVLVNAVLGLWDVVNDLTRLHPSRSDRYRVTIFGSARARPGTFAYDETRRVSKALTELGCDILTGGGPGLMRAANEGASDATAGQGQQSVGIRISLPFEQASNAFVTQVYEHRTFFTRLHHFVLASNAFVVAPGGIGTVLEAMMVWQLLQVGHLEATPLVFVGRMWPELVQWARAHMLEADLPLVSPEDLSIPRCVATGAEAIEVIRDDHDRWKRAQPLGLGRAAQPGSASKPNHAEPTGRDRGQGAEPPRPSPAMPARGEKAVMKPQYLVAQLRQLLARDPRTNLLDVQIRIVDKRVHIAGNVESASLREAVDGVVREAIPTGMEMVNELCLVTYVP